MQQRKGQVFLKFDELTVLEISAALRYNAAHSAYPMRQTGRRHCGIIYTKTGTEIYNFSCGKFYAVPDSVLLIPKGERYTIALDSEESSVSVIDFEIPDAIPAPRLIKDVGQTALPSLFREAEKVWKRKNTAYRSECLSILYKILALLTKQEEAGIHPSTFAKIRPAIDYLHENYTQQDFKVEELSRLVELDPKYFRTLFHKNYGMSPKEFVSQLKIERAKELLVEGKNSLTEIAARLGYSDVYHLSKAFKKKTGMTPTQYKKSQIEH